MTSVKISGLCAMACLFVVALGGAASPALAFDEGRGSSADLLLGVFGLSQKSEEPSINYRERAPLVLPPKTDLRQPKPAAAQRTGNWPQDQEAVAAARKRAQQGRVPLERVEEGVQVAGARELARNRMAPTPGIGQGECVMDTDRSNPRACSPEVFWNSLKVKKEEKPEMQAGVEPERKYLTQPPKGYMKGTQNVKATFDAPKRKDDEHHTDYFRRPQTRQD